MTRTIAEGIYNFLDVNNLPLEQKGCRKKRIGIKDQLSIDKTILRDYRKRHTNLGMARIDYKIKCMIWFTIHGYWKALNLCKHLATFSDL